MKKKKRFIKISSIAIMLVLSIFLTACNLEGGGGYTPPPYGPTEPNPTPSPVDPETPITELFSAFKVITTGQNVKITDPISNTQKYFNDLIDRQLDVLSNDILYRLVVVYGNGFTDDFDLNSNYKYRDKDAKINKLDVILTHEITGVANKNYRNEYNELVSNMFGNPIINDPAYYANSLKDGPYSSSHPISVLFNNTHTIAGGYEWIVDSEKYGFNDNLEASATSNYAWNWNYENANITTDETTDGRINKYINHYKPKLESAIIQILVGIEPDSVQENLTNNELDKHKNNIQHIGFNQKNRDNIQEFVLNTIIGESNIDADNDILSGLESSFGLTNGKLMFPDKESQEYENFMQDDTLHYYKAYDVLVPAMLDRAFFNSFGGKEIDRVLRDGYGHPIINETTNKVQYDEKHSLDNLENITTQNQTEFVTLYPKMTRSTDKDLKLNDDLINPNEPNYYMLGAYDEIKGVILQPKKGSAVQGLVMAVRAEADIKFEFKLRVKYVAKGVVHASTHASHHVSLIKTSKIFTVDGMFDPFYDTAGKPSRNEPYQFFVDIDGLISTKPYPTFNDYNGIDNSKINLWNNPYGLNGYNLAGDNYLELTFEIVSATKNGQTYTEPVKFEVGFADPF